MRFFRACANSRYQAIFPPPMWPGYEAFSQATKGGLKAMVWSYLLSLQFARRCEVVREMVVYSELTIEQRVKVFRVSDNSIPRLLKWHGSENCVSYSKQNMIWRFREKETTPIYMYESCFGGWESEKSTDKNLGSSWDSNPRPSDYLSDTLTIKPLGPLAEEWKTSYISGIA